MPMSFLGVWLTAVFSAYVRAVTEVDRAPVSRGSSGAV